MFRVGGRIEHSEIITLSLSDLFRISAKAITAKPATTKPIRRPTAPDGDRYLTVEEVAQHYGVTVRTVQNWPPEQVPPATRLGRRDWYLLSDVLTHGPKKRMKVVAPVFDEPAPALPERRRPGRPRRLSQAG